MLTKQEGRPRPVILSAAKELWHRCANRRGTEILRGAQDDGGALDPHMLSTSIIASTLVWPPCASGAGRDQARPYRNIRRTYPASVMTGCGSTLLPSVHHNRATITISRPMAVRASCSNRPMKASSRPAAVTIGQIVGVGHDVGAGATWERSAALVASACFTSR